MTELTSYEKSRLYSELSDFEDIKNIQGIRIYHNKSDYSCKAVFDLNEKEKNILFDMFINPRIDAIKKQLGEV
jgi:hypothetical protein